MKLIIWGRTEAAARAAAYEMGVPKDSVVCLGNRSSARGLSAEAVLILPGAAGLDLEQDLRIALLGRGCGPGTPLRSWLDLRHLRRVR